MSVYEVEPIILLPTDNGPEIAAKWGGQLLNNRIHNIRLSYQGIDALAQTLNRAVDCHEFRQVYAGQTYYIPSRPYFDQIIVEAPTEVANLYYGDEQIYPATPIAISLCNGRFHIRAVTDGQIKIYYKALTVEKRDILITKTQTSGLIYKKYLYKFGGLKARE